MVRPCSRPARAGRPLASFGWPCARSRIRDSIVRRKNTAECFQPAFSWDSDGWSMSTRCERPWPAIDLAELRYCLAFGSSLEEMADFLHRDVEDVRHQISVEAQRAESQRWH
jgi:hypothetical protein